MRIFSARLQQVVVYENRTEEKLLHASYLGVVPCVRQVSSRRLQKLKMMENKKNRHP